MPCYWTKLPDGTMVHLNMAKPRQQKCRWCGKPCTKLCDFVVSSPQQVTHRRTCDAPMCDEHAQNVEPDRDYCPNHLQEKK